MGYISLKQASELWNISERRIRRLIEENRIDGAVKIGNAWNIPEETNKPIDKRYKIEEDKFIIDIPNSVYDKLDKKKAILESKRPFPKETLKSLEENFKLEWTYNSNAIEGNTLTLKETKVVLEGITIGGKTMREHLEAINHKEAIEFLEELVKDNSELTEMNIKNIHAIVLKGIDNENAGRYRIENVIISGATHIPPKSVIVPELMEKLIYRYDEWKEKYHPIVVSALLHAEFVKIHPFIDGNGRTARLLMNFEAMKNGYPPIIIKTEETHKYYEALDKGAMTGDYTDFVIMVINQVEEMINLYLKLLKE
ncbi:MAG: Fic family protein [Clostridia bacterium]|nr:Fic family protein [Clostridia bacterium]